MEPHPTTSNDHGTPLVVPKDNSTMTTESEVLRFKFSDAPFGTVWRALHALDWKFVPPGYQAPDGQAFADSNSLCAHLDGPTVPEIFSNLQSLPAAVEEDGTVMEWRRAILERMRGRGDENHDEASDSPGSDEEETTISDPVRRSARSHRVDHDVSATRTEKGTDLYLHRKKGRRKSQSTASDADVPLPSIEECQRLVEQHSMKEVEELEGSYEQEHFADWRFLLTTNHSILLFGTGSKYELLNRFCENELNKEGYSLVVDCFDEDVTMQGILDLLVQLFLDGQEPKGDLDIELDEDEDVPVCGTRIWAGEDSLCARQHDIIERAQHIARSIAQEAAHTTLTPIFLALHNLDGLLQREDHRRIEKALSALTWNSITPNGTNSIRLIASVDHLDSANWISAPHWIWKEVHTFRPYSKEFKLLGDGTANASKKTTATGMTLRERMQAITAARALEVLEQMAPRHAEMVQTLARLQLDQPDSDWVEYKKFVNACKKEKFIVTRESQMHSYLLELKEHAFIQTKVENETTSITIPYDDDKLREFLAYQIPK